MTGYVQSMSPWTDARRACAERGRSAKNVGMNAIPRYQVPLLATLLGVGISIGACNARSDKEPQAGTTNTPTIPLVTAADSQQRTIEMDAGGIATRYTPVFTKDALVRIDEERARDQARGTYLFQGARLLRYEGRPIEGAGELLLEFDLQGKTLTARNGDAPAEAEDVSSIRARAQLLRNHALAQHASRMHSADR